jgi:hypothetical protein
VPRETINRLFRAQRAFEPRGSDSQQRRANKKAGETAGFFELIGSDRDQYFATTGPPQR